MPDAISGMIDLMTADAARLRYRNAYNITAMSVTPEDIAAAIRRHVPGFEIDYDVDPVRQAIADSWPRSLDDSAAHRDWSWKPKYDLDAMTADMLARLKDKLKVTHGRQR
jgi:nucleoside-diphosphate-sugar epimerase